MIKNFADIVFFPITTLTDRAVLRGLAHTRLCHHIRVQTHWQNKQFVCHQHKQTYHSHVYKQTMNIIPWKHHSDRNQPIATQMTSPSSNQCRLFGNVLRHADMVNNCEWWNRLSWMVRNKSVIEWRPSTLCGVYCYLVGMAPSDEFMCLNLVADIIL